ncbi:hypothetical protein LXA43DRAFT_314489 [Ganoderma leucocontextum]|nr:hypothetical protein LXA43DRAFT_314489 [Ganoderma leucocontextum]
MCNLLRLSFFQRPPPRLSPLFGAYNLLCAWKELQNSQLIAGKFKFGTGYELNSVGMSKNEPHIPRPTVCMGRHPRCAPTRSMQHSTGCRVVKSVVRRLSPRLPHPQSLLPRGLGIYDIGSVRFLCCSPVAHLMLCALGRAGVRVFPWFTLSYPVYQCFTSSYSSSTGGNKHCSLFVFIYHINTVAHWHMLSQRNILRSGRDVMRDWVTTPDACSPLSTFSVLFDVD